MHLGDWILWAIEASSDPQLAPARNILGRLRRRELYQIVLSPMHLPIEIRTEEQAKARALQLC
jgi:hypothetical protein